VCGTVYCSLHSWFGYVIELVCNMLLLLSIICLHKICWWRRSQGTSSSSQRKTTLQVNNVVLCLEEEDVLWSWFLRYDYFLHTNSNPIFVFTMFYSHWARASLIPTWETLDPAGRRTILFARSRPISTTSLVNARLLLPNQLQDNGNHCESWALHMWSKQWMIMENLQLFCGDYYSIV